MPVDQTVREIEHTLARYGAKRFAYFAEEEHAIIVFEADDSRIRFDLPLPSDKTDKGKQLRRQRWRALLLAIKSKLESVESGIETFQEAFLSHIVLLDGITLGQHARPWLKDHYAGKPMQPLLPAPKRD